MEKRLKIKEVRFRIPDALYLRLKKIAHQNKRSVTTQAEWYIENGLKAEEKSIVAPEKKDQESEKKGPQESIDVE